MAELTGKSEILEAARAAYRERHIRAAEWKREGKKIVGFLYSMVPEELITAADIVPVQLVEGASSASYQSGNAHFGDFYCDCVSSFLGQGIDGTYGYLDGVIFSDACEITRVLGGLWELLVPTPLFFYLNSPSEPTPGGKVFFASQLDKLRASIEKIRGKPVTPQEIANAIQVHNRNRLLLKQLRELRQRKLAPLSEQEYLDLFMAGLVMPKEEHNRLLGQAVKVLSTEKGLASDGPRLLVSVFICEELFTPGSKIMDYLEQAGARVSVNDVTFGPRYYWKSVPERDDPMNALVERYAGDIPIAFHYSSDARADMLLKEAKEQEAKGAIFFVPKHCTCYLWDQPHIESRLRKEGISTLLIETMETMATEAIKTRLQAFIEMLS